MLYRLAEKEDMKAVCSLWQRVFGDSDEALKLFFTTFDSTENVLLCEIDGKVVSILTLLNAKIVSPDNEYNAYCVYAAATDENYRKNGIMSGLLSYACKIAKERNADFLFLKPANEKLFSYYRKNGFQDAFYRAERLEYNDKEKYNYSYVQWYENAISVDKVFSELNSYETKNGYLSFTAEGKIITVDHFVSGNIFALLDELKNDLHPEKIYVNLPCKTSEAKKEVTGMIKPLTDKKPPENIYLGITLE